MATHLLACAVVFERERGSSWEDIGRYLHLSADDAEQRFAVDIERWHAALEHVATSSTRTRRGHELPRALADPAWVGDDLDRWAKQHITLTKDFHEVTGSLLGLPGPGEGLPPELDPS